MDKSKVNIVLGPPGTGKTTDMIGVVELSLAAKISPRRIGFISFTKKAAEEGSNRACAKFNLTPEDLPYFRTLHSLAFRQLGMRRDQMMGWQHIKQLGLKLGLDFKGRDVVDDEGYGMSEADRMLFMEGVARNSQRPLKEVWEEANEDSINWEELERFALALRAFKLANHLTDYTDLLERFCEKGQSPEFDTLIVDEAQDLSTLQWRMVEILAAHSKQVFVAGDDDQSLYTWAGANVERFISLEGGVKVLNHSYRVPKTVFEVANSIISKISRRRPKVWSPCDRQGSEQWYSSIEEVDMSKDTWLLLARNGYMLNDLEDWCMIQGFSFHSINRDPLKGASLAAIKVWENLRRGKDESAEHILQALWYVNPGYTPPMLMKRLKAAESGAQIGMPDLVGWGLRTTDIWHQALTKIPARERDFFIAARQRGEPLLKEPRIKISTIHAAKGGEADHVVLLTDMSYRCYTNMQENFDDEARVWYVAATRCRNSLNLIMPKTDLSFEI